jgi:RNA ligase (TIGR02306 family)
MRKLASIRLIDDVLPIANADRLEQVAIGGWRIVVAKGEFAKGDKVVYFEIDSALPADDIRYEFLKERCLRKWMCSGRLVCEVIRIKSIKLRGVVSQGLVIPLTDFPELTDTEVGTDVTEALNVKHYDELHEEYSRITGSARIAGNAKGNFPTHLVPKTDEERLQNLTEYFDGRFKGVPFEVTEKFDGSSATYIYAPNARPDDPFFVCSRNLELKEEEGNLYWEIAYKYRIFDTLKSLRDKVGYDIAIQGEIVGPGVNGNRDRYTEHEFYVFRIYNITDGKWLCPSVRRHICACMGVPHVKGFGTLPIFDTLNTMDAFLKHVEGKTDRGNEREGMVFKSVGGTVSFKVINNKYLLKEK